MGPLTSLTLSLLQQCERLDTFSIRTGLSKELKHDDADTFDVYQLDRTPHDSKQLRVSISDDAQKLVDLASEPKESITQALYGASAHVETHIPLHGETTFREISATSGLEEYLVRRYLQVACMKHIFRQISPTIICHTASSRLIASSPGVMDEIDFITNNMAFAAAHELAALSKNSNDGNGATTEQNKAGFSVAYQTSNPIYTGMAKTPDRSRRFGGAMRQMTSGSVFAISHLISRYDWASLAERDATNVVAGGDHGFVSPLLLDANPGLYCVVQDLPATEEVGKKNLPADKAGAIKKQVHDFFERQPVEGDIFFLRWILDNWSGKYCVKILQNIIPSMTKPVATIVVHELMLPELLEPENRFDYYCR
ncbi:MAG: hypothetical protein Q9160_000956 [Pyrenula sp. 1 TL-2023]